MKQLETFAEEKNLILIKDKPGYKIQNQERRTLLYIEAIKPAIYGHRYKATYRKIDTREHSGGSSAGVVYAKSIQQLLTVIAPEVHNTGRASYTFGIFNEFLND
jgi:hypothetical protein